MKYNTYMRRLRSRWMFSQGELAELLDVDQCRVSHYEKGDEYPSLSVALGLQVIFGSPPRTCFSTVYQAVEEAIITRAATVERALANKRDPVSVKKHQLLTAMMNRATKRGSA